ASHGRPRCRRPCGGGMPTARSSTVCPYTTLFRSQRDPGKPGLGRAFLLAHPKGDRPAPGVARVDRAWPATVVHLGARGNAGDARSEEHTSELQSRENLVCRLLLEKKKSRRPTAGC